MVTADHVYATYLEDLGQNSSLVCQLGVLPFDLNDALIDRDQDLDIATFAISEANLARIPGTPVDCTGDWPPRARSGCERSVSPVSRRKFGCFIQPSGRRRSRPMVRSAQ